CTAAGVDLVFAPTPDVVYPEGDPGVRVSAGPLGDVLEGQSRPGHFDGMLTVVVKLLGIVHGDTVVFGQKDAQQVFLVRQAVRDLNLPVDVVAVPIVREPDGLARSSRNRYLSAAERGDARVLSRALTAMAREAAEGGARPKAEGDAAGPGGSAAAVRRAGLDVFAGTPAAKLDYLAVVDPATFTEVAADFRGEALAIVAAKVGTTRLIDNKTIVMGQARRLDRPLG
ncbi:MAG TPA: pantoate--beta-alanine ligase, partial [Microbacteriaceae bacterium]|nr:pantoate--beta-alanine ligase [Microbacteriaceae bacterium]